MNPDGDAARNGDVDMTLSHHGELEEDAPGSGTRAMSLDPPENGDSTTHASSKRELLLTNRHLCSSQSGLTCVFQPNLRLWSK